jgi:hypothetical protein
MQFAVTNTGKVPVRNLRFSCGLRGRTVYIGSLRIGNISPADYLPRGQTITRTCFNESNDVTDATLVVTVHFDWPVLPVSEAKDVSFVPVRTTNGFVMVPDYQNN